MPRCDFTIFILQQTLKMIITVNKLTGVTGKTLKQNMWNFRIQLMTKVIASPRIQAVYGL